jgi:hypothetical protein
MLSFSDAARIIVDIIVPIIPGSVQNFEFGLRESSPGSMNNRGLVLQLIQAPFFSLNPGALTLPKFKVLDRSWYNLGCVLMR